MASTSAVSMAMPLSNATEKRVLTSRGFLKPLAVRSSKVTMGFKSSRKFKVSDASLKEKAIAALTASMVIPEVAEAAESGVSPSLKNFLLSIGAGGVVLAAIIGAIIAVSNFDPVKRG